MTTDEATKDGDGDSFPCPTLAELVLVPAGGEKLPVNEGGKMVVIVRGLKPNTLYRVQVWGF